jgi:hypothetical protein
MRFGMKPPNFNPHANVAAALAFAKSAKAEV